MVGCFVVGVIAMNMKLLRNPHSMRNTTYILDNIVGLVLVLILILNSMLQLSICFRPCHLGTLLSSRLYRID